MKLGVGDVQMLSLYLEEKTMVSGRSEDKTPVEYLPFIIDSFNNESKGWADTIDVFPHDSLDYRCLSSIIEPTTTESPGQRRQNYQISLEFLTASGCASPCPLAWLSVKSTTFCPC